MNKELFGVFGDKADFERFRSPTDFDRVVEGETTTVGVRDVGLGIPGRTAVEQTDDGVAVVWGEAYVDRADAVNAAAHLLSTDAEPPEVFSDLNGSFLAVLDDAGNGQVVTDPVRSWECFYTDDPGVRVFGTDAAAVARTMDDPAVAIEPLVEFTHFGVVLEDRTLIEGLHRIPFDGTLTADGTVELERFVYEPRSFDYATELARRIERALARRSTLPGRKGLLLSGGYDSRVILSGISDVDVCYTIGTDGNDEVTVARKLASQYGVDHRRFEPDGRYLNTSADVTRYGQGLYESLHVHHGGFLDEMAVDTMFHGSLGDTLMRGHFRPLRSLSVFGLPCPPYRVDHDPDVPDHFAEKFGYIPAAEFSPLTCDDGPISSADFVRRRFETICDQWDDRFDSMANAMALIGIQNQPTMSFRYHLADNFIESFVFTDAEIVDWHLTTPPEHRNTRTFLEAIQKIDPEILRHRPADRPTTSFTLNQVYGFLGRTLPFVPAYNGPWPDRNALYEHNALDHQLFPGYPELHDLPWRLKLRINDLTNWLELATGTVPVRPDEVICGPEDARSSVTRISSPRSS